MLVKKIVQTAVVFLVTIITGTNMGAIVATFPAMEVRTSSNTAQMMTIFIWFGVGTTLGVMVVNPLFHRVHGMLLLSILCALMAVFAGLAPTWTSLVTFQVLASLLVTVGCIILAGSLSVIRSLWKRLGCWLPPIFQATSQFTPMVGYAIAPQVIKPFIHIHSKRNDDIGYVVVPVPSSYAGLAPVQVGYLVLAALDVVMAVVCLIAWVWDGIRNGSSCSVWEVVDEENDDGQVVPDQSETSSQDEGQKLQADVQQSQLKPSSRQGIFLLTIAALFVLTEESISTLYNGILYTYLNVNLEMSVQLSTLLVSVFQAEHLLFGSITIVLSRWVSSKWLLLFDLVCYPVSAALMWAAVNRTTGNEVLTAIGLLVGAIADCNTFPTFVMQVEETIPVIAPVMALFYMTSGASMIIVGPIAGAALNYTGAASYPVMILALGLICGLIAVIYFAVLRFIKFAASQTTDPSPLQNCSPTVLQR